MEQEALISYAVQRGIQLGIEAYRNEEKRKRANPRILIVKNEAEKLAGGRKVLLNLERRGFINPYQFGVENAIDEDGEPFKKVQGRIYYRLAELEQALEDGNILKGIRKRQIQ